MRYIYTQYEYMNFRQLREYFKLLRTRQKMWYGLPMILSVIGLYLSIITPGGVVGDLESGVFKIISNYSMSILMWVVFVVVLPLLPINKLGRRFIPAGVMAAFTLLAFLMGCGCAMVSGILMLYLALADIFMRSITGQVLFMRSLPDFPFPERVELERKREALAHTYSERSETTKKLTKDIRRESYDGSQTEKLFREQEADRLKKKEYIPENFDELETGYTDKLAGETADKRDTRRQIFAEPKAVFTDIDKQPDLYVERRSMIEDAEAGKNPEYKTAKRAMSADRRTRFMEIGSDDPVNEFFGDVASQAEKLDE